MSIYNDIDYRKILRNIVDERKKLDRSSNFQNLAKAIRVQKAYLSNCLKGKADLSFDQLYLVCEYLNLDSEQSEYLSLLLDFERSSLKSRKEKILKEIHEIQNKHIQTDKHITAKTLSPGIEGLSEYYLDPLNQIVHVCLAIPHFQENLKLLAHTIAVPMSRITNSISILEKLGIIAKQEGKFKVLAESVHLPADSPVYASWRNELKIMAIHRLRNLNRDNSYSFSVIFAADEKTRKQIQDRFLKFLKDIEPVAKKAPSEKAYQMSFDFFPWTEV